MITHYQPINRYPHPHSPPLSYTILGTYDTAGSAKMIKEGNLLDCAAIASDLAGLTYGLDILDSNIEDHDNNFTRYTCVCAMVYNIVYILYILYYYTSILHYITYIYTLILLHAFYTPYYIHCTYTFHTLFPPYFPLNLPLIYPRFLLLSRSPVNALIPPSMPAKTSIVFLLPNDPGMREYGVYCAVYYVVYVLCSVYVCVVCVYSSC